MRTVRTFGTTAAVSALLLVLAAVHGGRHALLSVVGLAAIEISLSCDNAIVNAVVLTTMSPKWQRLFLTLGLAIAVFGVRLLLPVAIVAISTHAWPWIVLHDAVADPQGFGTAVAGDRPILGCFGAVFLLLTVVAYTHEKRPSTRERTATAAASAVGLGVVAVALVVGGAHTGIVAATLSGAVLSVALGRVVARSSAAASAGAASGLSAFLALEALDASVSMDGVAGAFAVSDDIVAIGLGLGIGALFVRSATVAMARTGKLAQYRYLEPAAFSAIGFLGIVLLVGLRVEVPSALVSVGVVTILLAGWLASRIAISRASSPFAEAERAPAAHCPSPQP